MLTCEITLPDSPHPIIIVSGLKISPDFGHFVLLDGMNSVSFSFNRYIFGCWLLPEKLAFVRKIMALPESGGWGDCSPLTLANPLLFSGKS